MAPIQSNLNCSPGTCANTWWCNRLDISWLGSITNKKTSMNHKCIIKKSQWTLVWGLRCPVSSYSFSDLFYDGDLWGVFRFAGILEYNSMQIWWALSMVKQLKVVLNLEWDSAIEFDIRLDLIELKGMVGRWQRYALYSAFLVHSFVDLNFRYML